MTKKQFIDIEMGKLKKAMYKKIGEANKINMLRLWRNPEFRKMMSKTHKGRPSGMLGKHHTEEARKKISEANKRRFKDEKERKKMSEALKGRKFSEETRRKDSEAHRGEKCNFWKGGITPENQKIRRSIEYRLWREAVFARDNWTCQKCGQRGGELDPHHILNFAEHPELRFALDNGITLCRNCHKKFHKKYGYKNNTKEQLEDFLNL